MDLQIPIPEDPSRKREFICACSKSYYSYAALFTHVKQKHDGKPPGPLIKPQSENKRGRPRKIVNLEPTSAIKTQSSLAQSSGNMNKESTPNSNSQKQHYNSNNPVLTLRSTPGSHFRSYQPKQEQIPTILHMSEPLSIQKSLLNDVVYNVSMSTALNSQISLSQFKVYALLKQQVSTDSLLGCIQGFLLFCKTWVPVSVHSQIQLLLVVLLQHVHDKSDKSIKKMRHVQLSQYVQSFFEELQTYGARWGLFGVGVFCGLSPMKVLVALYNWINSHIPLCSESTSSIEE